MKLKPPTVLRSRKLQGLVAVGVTFAGLSGMAVAQSAPASADPSTTYVAVGSDTIQDVYNGFATAFGGNLLGSWNATNPVTGAVGEVITPVSGAGGVNGSFNRPNGSGPGIAALRYSLGDHSVAGSLQGTAVPQAGSVDIARSSSAPPSGGYAGTDAIQYVPFAIDGVTGATGPAAGDPSIGTTFSADHGNGTTSTETIVQTQLNLTEVNDFTLQNLKDLYGAKGWTTVTVGASTADYKALGETDTATPAPADSKTIDLYIPQLGSGTEKFWVGTVLGLSAPEPWDSPTIEGGAPADLIGVPVEEHDGTDVATDPLGFTPFSIAQWISQRNGHNDRRHGATLANANLQDPFANNGVPATGSLNTGLGVFNRDVWSVVKQSRVLAGGDLNGLLASSINGVSTGHTATLCTESVLIASYGFGRLSSCGAVVTPDDAQQI